MLWTLTPLFLAAPTIPVHQDAVRLCIVQPPEMHYGYLVNGDDARRLAWELSRRTLADGRLLLTITLVGYSTKAAAVEVQNQQCAYIAEVRHHQSADVHVTMSIPNLPNPPSLTDQLPSTHDRDAIMVEMKDLATRKIVLRVSAPRTTHYGKSDVVFTPFPMLAKELLAKLNALPR